MSDDARPPDSRPQVLVHSEWRSEEDVRAFYEVSEEIAGMVRSCATVDGEPFESCLYNIVLERERLRQLLVDLVATTDLRAAPDGVKRRIGEETKRIVTGASDLPAQEDRP